MAFIEQISDYITRHYDLTKENLTVVFPNKRAALQLRKELKKRITYKFCVPNIVSIQQAMEEWSGLQLIDNIDVVFELVKINASHKNNDISNSFFGLATQMAKDFDEIDQYNVDAKNLFSNLVDIKKIEEWDPEEKSETVSNYVIFFKSLIMYYDELRNSLAQNNLGYYGLITRKIASYDDETLLQKANGKKIIFAGFNALTTTEENVIVRLVEKGNAVILWDLDNYYFNDEKQEAGYFARKFFEKHPNFEKNFIGDNFSAMPQKKINVINVSGSGLQPNALQIHLNNEIKDGNVNNSNRCAIVLADESLLIPTLNFIPDSVDKISVTMGYPYSKTITYHFINQLFKYHNNLSSNSGKIYLWNFIKLCNTEFIKQIFGKDYNSLVNWIDQLTQNSQYYFGKDDLNVTEIPSELIDFLKVILTKWETPNDCIESLNNLMTISINRICSSNNNFIKNQISLTNAIINRISLLVSKYGSNIQLTDLQVLFTQVANQCTIKLNKKEDDLQEDEVVGTNQKQNAKKDELEVQIMGLLETRNLDFDVVHFLSVNEGILPQSKSNNSLIPYDLRKEFHLPIYKHQQAVYAYHFFRLLQNAKVVNLYYNSLADKNGQGEPSRFIRQIEYENKNVELKHFQYKSQKINNNNSKIEIDKTPEILDKIKSFSPSSISDYIICPLKYYFKHIEHINDEILDEEIQVNQIGKIIHSTLENFYSKFGNDIITSGKFDQVYKDDFTNCYNKALEDNNFKSGLPNTGFNYLSNAMIDSMLGNFFKKEKEFILNGETGPEKYTMSIDDLEKKFSHNFTISGRTIELKGFADRIDKINDKIRVIDYKTGGVEKRFVTVNEAKNSLGLMDQKSIQLLIYKYLYIKENPETNPNKLEPLIIGLRNLSKDFKLEFSKKKDSDNEFIDNLENDFVNTFEKCLMEFFETVFVTETKFMQTDDDNNCKNCKFASICKRERK